MTDDAPIQEPFDPGAAPVIVAVPSDPATAAAAAREAVKPAVIQAETAAKEADAARTARTAGTTTVTDTLKDIDGQFSSKRIAAFAALALFLALAVSDTVAHAGKPTEFVMTDLMYIALGGLGLGALERFGQKGSR